MYFDASKEKQLSVSEHAHSAHYTDKAK